MTNFCRDVQACCEETENTFTSLKKVETVKKKKSRHNEQSDPTQDTIHKNVCICTSPPLHSSLTPEPLERCLCRKTSMDQQPSATNITLSLRR